MIPWPQVVVLEADILSIRLEALARQYGWKDRPWVVVGNLPYSITSPILEWGVQQRRLINRCLFTVQKEFAQRMVAQPGSKAYGSLSVFVQYVFWPKALFTIGRGQFAPRPKVDSTCLKLVPHLQPPVKMPDEARFFRFVQSLFAYRRKTLLNALQRAGRCSRLEAEGCLARCGLDPLARPETLSVAQLASLVNALPLR